MTLYGFWYNQARNESHFHSVISRKLRLFFFVHQHKCSAYLALYSFQIIYINGCANYLLLARLGFPTKLFPGAHLDMNSLLFQTVFQESLYFWLCLYKFSKIFRMNSHNRLLSVNVLKSFLVALLLFPMEWNVKTAIQ